MSTQLNKFIKVLEEMFQFDQADLDFGIYRIMNQKREDVSRFLKEDLVPQVKQAFEKYKNADVETIKEEIAKLEKQLADIGVAKESSEKYMALQGQLNKGVDITALENEVYSDLTNFFKRYYHEGDFMSLRRYKKDVYAIPYEGEEVKLHWANTDQYYVKSLENFRDYTFTLPSEKKVHFKLVDANTEQNNNKAQEGKERRFILVEEEPLKEVNGELYIYFEYRIDRENRKREKINAETLERVLTVNGFESWIEQLQALSPTEKNKNRTILEKHLNDYTARNSFDYFIHKDLGGFLRRELDFFIKNEIMHLDDLDTENEKRFEQYLSKVKVIKLIGTNIIKFLEQIENFQKKLWLKKKFIIETNWCLTLDKIDSSLYQEIATNDNQRKEWEKLFGIKEIEGDLEKEPYSVPLSIDFLKQNQYLILDTKFFCESFKNKIISNIENVDDNVNGILIHSENFQALNFLQKKYQKKIKSIYIDPPYNTAASEILYKNNYKHSSWLSMLSDRVALSYNLGKDNSIYCFAIDDFELSKFELALNQLFGEMNQLAIVPVRSNPHGRAMASGFSVNHEYALFYQMSNNSIVGRLPRDENKLARYSEKDDQGIYTWINFRGTGANTRRVDRPKLYYPVYVNINNNNVRIPNLLWNDIEQRWIPSEELSIDEVMVYPIDESNNERVWTLGWERAQQESDLNLEGRKKGESFQIYRKYRPNQEGALPSTWWHDAKYSATESGTRIIKDLFGVRDNFSYPKSINLVEDCLRVSLESETDIILDYFSGSGTTGQAVINLNREDDGKRKYILIEMGEHFNTVTKPRIQKVIYSKDWKEGKPISREGTSHIFKYFRLETFEDTLNNIELNKTDLQKKTLEQQLSLEAKEEYYLSYMLDVETKGSQSLLNIDEFKNPFDYKMKISNGTETKVQKVDVVETFNYLIGLQVNTIDFIRGFQIIKGKLRTGENALIIWRNQLETTNEDLEQLMNKLNINSRDFEFDRIYVNGDNHIENLKIDESKWKVVLIEEEFKRLMFDVQDV